MSAGRGGGAQRTLQNTAVLALARIIDRVATLVVVLMIAPRFGADGLGVYATAMALYGVIAIAGYAGINQYLVREISRYPDRTASYTIHLSVVGLTAGIVLTAASQLAIPHLGYSADLEQGVAVILVALLPKILNTVQEAVFLAHGRVAFETLTRLVSSVSYILLSAVLLSSGYGIAELLMAYVAIEYVVAAVYYVLINRSIARLRARFRPALMFRLIREMKTFTASSALAALFARPEVIILSLLVSERDVGLYSAALRIAELPVFLPDVFMANVFPRLSKAFKTDEKRFAAWNTAALRAVAAFSFPLAAFLLASADELVRLLYGPDFASAAPLLRILVVNLVAVSFATVFWRALPARGRQSSVLITQCIVIGVRLGGGTAVIALFAATGAAIASSASAVLNAGLLGLATARSGVHFSMVSVCWRFILASAGSGAAVWLALRWAPVPVALVAGGLTYIAALVLMRAVTPEEWALLRSLRSSRTTRATP